MLEDICCSICFALYFLHHHAAFWQLCFVGILKTWIFGFSKVSIPTRFRKQFYCIHKAICLFFPPRFKQEVTIASRVNFRHWTAADLAASLRLEVKVARRRGGLTPLEAAPAHLNYPSAHFHSALFAPLSKGCSGSLGPVAIFNLACRFPGPAYSSWNERWLIWSVHSDEPEESFHLLLNLPATCYSLLIRWRQQRGTKDLENCPSFCVSSAQFKSCFSWKKFHLYFKATANLALALNGHSLIQRDGRLSPDQTQYFFPLAPLHRRLPFRTGRFFLNTRQLVQAVFFLFCFFDQV